MASQPKVAHIPARPAAAPAPAWWRLLGDARSTVAVEFAMIGAALFTFLFAIFFLGIAQFWQMTLDDSVRNATRQLQINPNLNSTDFVADVCGEFGLAVSNCSTSLNYVVQNRASFTAIVPAAITASGFAGGNKFPQGILTSSDPTLVQVAYKFPIAVPFLPISLITLNGTPYLLSAASAIEEP